MVLLRADDIHKDFHSLTHSLTHVPLFIQNIRSFQNIKRFESIKRDPPVKLPEFAGALRLQLFHT